jgi:hypothetical protein
LSDLANSCENLNIDKQCAAIVDNPKAQVTRQLKCLNDEKNTCCYLCISRSRCIISCKYLGQTENYTQAPPAETLSAPAEENVEEVQAPQVENVPVTFCFSCNTEMAWAKTKFTIDGWNGPKPEQTPDKVLPLTVYLCPKCGKIEFHADQKQNEAY